MPVLAAIFARPDSSARDDAAWLACENHERIVSLQPALLGAVLDGRGRPRRGVLSALAYLRPPAVEALPILEPLLEPALSAPSHLRLPLDDQFMLCATIDALAAVEPPPSHLADRFSAALARAPDSSTLMDHLVFALARLAPERVVAQLAALPDIATFARKRVALACLATAAIPTPMRIAWLVRLLGETSDGAVLADAFTKTQLPPELIAPLCRQLRRGGSGLSTITVLGRYDRALVLPELEPLITDGAAAVRRRALDFLFATEDGDIIARYLADPDPPLVRRAKRWLVLHGGAQLISHLAAAR